MNVFAVLWLLGAIGLALVVSEWLARRHWVPAVAARKLLHVVAVGCCALAQAFFTNLPLLQGIIAACTLILLVVVKRGWLRVDSYHRKSWGIALFPAAYLVLLLLFGRDHPWLVTYPMLVLALADAAAALAGTLFSKQFFTVTGDQKSITGSGALFISAIAILLFGPMLLPTILHGIQNPPLFEFNFWLWMLLAIAVAFFATVLEAGTSGGWDNFSVPLGVAALLAMASHEFSFSVPDTWLAITLAAAVAYTGFKRHALNAGGAFATFLLGVLVWRAGGMPMALPLLMFFITGSLLSRWNKAQGPTTDAKHSKPRDAWQVLCNGGVAGVGAIAYGIWGAEWGFMLLLASAAVSTADTWSSETGMRWGTKVYDIISRRPVVAGLSGGISLQGTLGGMAGGLLIGCCALWWYPFWAIIPAVGVVGTLGMLIDSLLGSLLQAKYAGPIPGTLADSPTTHLPSVLAKGYACINNDVVNLLSNGLVAGTATLLWWLLAV